MVDVKVPVLAESVSEATLMTWHKKEGEPVTRGENLIDIETDKVTLEVAAMSDGVLSEILKGDGEIVQSDEVIARIDADAKAAAKPAASDKSDKPETGGTPEQQSLPVDNTSADAGNAEPTEDPKTSPAVRNLLNENNLKARDIPDSNADGRITKEDVVSYLDTRQQQKTTAPKKADAPSASQRPAASESQAKPAATSQVNLDGRPEERVKMTRLRQRTAERLLNAQHENAILTTFNEVNMKPVMEIRSRYKEAFEKKHGTKLGFMSFFTKAATEALKRFPVINASIDGADIIYHGYFDIGIAVSAPRGLVVPIIRDADTLSFADIENKIVEYGQKAKDSKLTIDEMTGGTFTITNGGIFGSLLSTPILNPPQSAILGMHKIQERPMAVNGEVVVLPIMYLALSYDHRIVDGRDAVQFLVTIKDMLEDPSRLLLEV